MDRVTDRATQTPGSPRRAIAYAHVRAPKPIVFPTEETVPESKRHLLLRTALFQILRLESAGRFSVGSDQFVYWNARDAGRRLSPDVLVHTGRPDDVFASWKTWERGAPQLGVEIVSDSDEEHVLAEKLDRYQEAGFEEVVGFDPAKAPGQRLRVWDRIEGDLVERVVEGDHTECRTLGLWWLVRDAAETGCALWLSRDAEGRDLLPLPEEKGRTEGRAEGHAQGRREGVREAAQRLVAWGMSRDEVARLLGIAPDAF
jgi:Uma2 family endonuclease